MLQEQEPGFGQEHVAVSASIVCDVGRNKDVSFSRYILECQGFVACVPWREGQEIDSHWHIYAAGGVWRESTPRTIEVRHDAVGAAAAAAAGIVVSAMSVEAQKGKCAGVIYATRP